MPFTHPVPDWNAQGAEPPESLKTTGWAINQRPPADYFNWFFYNTAKAIIELQLEAINTDQKGVANGLATLDASGKVPASQLNVSAPPDATTSTKGVVQLSNSTTSTSEVLAATSKAVKDAKDGLSTQISILSDSVVPYGTASGTNAKTISITDGFATLKTGLALSFKNTTANTGAVTLDVNGLGAKPVVKSGGTALSSGNLKAGGVYTVRYDGTSFILQGEGGSGNALASDLLSGKTASTDAGDIIGTMPNRGTFNLALGATVPAGYYSGGTVPAGKLIAEVNIGNVSNSSYAVSGDTITSSGTSITISNLGFVPQRIILIGSSHVFYSGISEYVAFGLEFYSGWTQTYLADFSPGRVQVTASSFSNSTITFTFTRNPVGNNRGGGLAGVTAICIGG